PLIETKTAKKKSWWVALTMPLLFLFDKGEAQENISNQNQDTSIHKRIREIGKAIIVNDTIKNVSIDTSGINKLLENKMQICEPPVETNNKLTGTVGMISYKRTKKQVIKGKVIDQNNYPIPFATITEKGTHNAIAADANGFFNIEIKNATLTASAAGLETTDKKIDFSEDSITIVMMRKSMTLSGDVVVTVGGISACHRVKTIDTLHSTAKKFFGTAMFKVYPNPVINNSTINLQIKSPGNYQMQLLNNQSKLMQAEEINVATKNSITQIQVQSNITAGMYYLRLINEETKKQYTEKLIIQ
ncbi:MAG: carboxypeptidase-like regulatory domain-containing protein, partial [Parafilimonas sp.]|nr:carboxypeptidase-like regulatory domain-containing protein [Parafilimonas sp.]